MRENAPRNAPGDTFISSSQADVEWGGQHGGAVAAGAFTENLPSTCRTVACWSSGRSPTRPGYRVASQKPVPHFFTGTELDSLFVRRVHGDVLQRGVGQSLAQNLGVRNLELQWWRVVWQSFEVGTTAFSARMKN
jgi:hypothetical protein